MLSYTLLLLLHGSICRIGSVICMFVCWLCVFNTLKERSDQIGHNKKHAQSKNAGLYVSVYAFTK